jgi:hypothetical protein
MRWSASSESEGANFQLFAGRQSVAGQGPLVSLSRVENLPFHCHTLPWAAIIRNPPARAIY